MKNMFLVIFSLLRKMQIRDLPLVTLWASYLMEKDITKAVSIDNVYFALETS